MHEREDENLVLFGFDAVDKPILADLHSVDGFANKFTGSMIDNSKVLLRFEFLQGAAYGAQESCSVGSVIANVLNIVDGLVKSMTGIVGHSDIKDHGRLEFSR